MTRLAVPLSVLLLALHAAPGGSAGSTERTDLTITASDGVRLAATLVEPSAPGRYPALLMLHGLGGTRHDLLPLAGPFAAAGYVVLVPDFRGHGDSGGLVSLDGPREIQDVRELVDWLRARPEVDPARIGGWGISLGGAAILRAAVQGVRFAALETVETWTNLYSALAPQNLSKSGAVYALLNAVPADKQAPEVLAIARDAIRSRHLPLLRRFAALRSSAQLLSRLRTPLYMFQGRRDFAFDIAQATTALHLVQGPHKLLVGDFGHSPSTFPGPDIGLVMSEGTKWFDHFLRGTGTERATWVRLSTDPWRGAAIGYTGLPATKRAVLRFAGRTSIGPNGVVVRSAGPTRRVLETFGSGSVRFRARPGGGWPRLVAVLVARRGQADTVVSEGGLPTAGLSGWRTLTVRLLDDATLIRAGSTLRLYLAATSAKEDPANLLYLDLGVPSRARVSVGSATVSLPVLVQPVSR